jgi:hypothetical protein
MSSSSVSNPIGAFVERRMKYRTLRPQVALAAVAGLLFAGNIAAVYAVFSGTAARQIYGGVTYAVGVVSAFAPLLVWLGATTVTFLLARVIGARVEFSVLLRSTGWGVAPLVGAAGSLSVGRYLALRGTDPCALAVATCERATYVELTAQVDTIFAVAGAATGGSAFLIGYAVAVGFFLLTGYLWYLAAHRASTLTEAGAVIAVGVPVVAILALFTSVTF